jgi:putative tryptophan/tyrosine transport system substrate-binding protein
MRFGRPLLSLFATVAALLALAGAARAETRVSVLYPDSSAPYVKLYQTIIDGMAQAGDLRLQSRAVSDRDTADDLRNWSQTSQVTIVLGELPPAITAPLAATMPMIHGAATLNDNNLPGVSLAASPAQLFKRLRQLKPDVDRVYVVFRPPATGWLITAAKLAAREQGLDLQALACDDAQQAGAAFGRALQQARPGRDAIWLTLDPVVPLNQMLPVLLRESWDKQLVLFSNNPVDVAKGALFALYPDYPAMGRQLAERAKKQMTKSATTGPEASERLNGALNTRTAAHLGITLTDQQRQAFDRIFPEAGK